jgi:hypothetical protein
MPSIISKFHSYEVNFELFLNLFISIQWLLRNWLVNRILYCFKLQFLDELVVIVNMGRVGGQWPGHILEVQIITGRQSA